MGDAQAVAPLIALLSDEDVGVRREAAEALGKLGWRPESDLQRAQSAIAVGDWGAVQAMGSAGFEPLIARLSDQDAQVRRYAAEALGELGDARAVWPLIRLLEGKDYRAAAVEALGQLGDARAAEVNAAIARLSHQDAQVRPYAAKALVKLGEAAVEPLIAVLSDQMPR